jgi:large subunit ribosomal protein L23
MNLIITPRVSEKAYGQAGSLNTYVFVVPLSANKIEVKKAVETQYEVNVTKVNIVLIDGKSKKSYTKRGRTIKGQRADIKKAYVTIKQGQTIPVFASQEEEAK